MTNNDVLRAVDEQAKADCESGLTSDLYDINKDGKINGFDTYSFILYVSDLRNGITAENSVLPVDQWNFIDTKVDLDNDDIAGTFVDFTIFTYVTGFLDDVSDYELDIYYLELVEKKGLTDLSDIRPYIEKLCEDKETGDVDFDGMVTAADASQVLHYYSQLSVDEEVSLVTESMMQYMADCNVDGIVDSVDASAILAAYAQNSVLS
ncbi:dockerin type I domain-containing protein [Ruminococcus sp.]|uniref:dockerin type I domain-containing protein n=1 Tax=Ruminococcus sp. TaxID=41978 RepID=UPI0025F96770|nr:dockerin type I domain-containing protein [Ruminococcus sp.]